MVCLKLWTLHTSSNVNLSSGAYKIKFRTYTHHIFIFSVNSLPKNSPECKQSFVLLSLLLLLLLLLDVFGESTTKCSVEQNSLCSDCSYRRVSGDSCSGGDVESRLDGEMLPCPVGGKPSLYTHLIVCYASFC